MSVYGEAKAWLRAVALRRRAEREMHEEMTAHIEQAAERFVARGMSEREAMHAARREFGNVAVIQELSRDSRGGRWVDNFTTDVRYALRYFARTPLTTVTIVLTMMLAVGGNAALYSVMYGYFFNPPPGMIDDPTLVGIRAMGQLEGSYAARALSYTELMEYGQARVFAGVAGFMTRSALIDFGKGPEDKFATTLSYVTPNHFSVLRVPFAAGAGFSQTRFDEHRETELTAVVSHALAEKEFGTIAGAIGKTVRVNDVVVTIVGVTRARFAGAVPGRDGRAIWLPVSALPAVEASSAAIFANLDSVGFWAIGRLANGVSASEALPEIRQITARNVAALAAVTKQEAHQRWLRNSRTDLGRLRNAWREPPMRADTIAGLAAVVLFDLIILLVCATTVSSLLVGNAINRRHEIGVRLSLGASRLRIVRQLITESMLLSLVGGASGLLIFGVLIRIFATQLSSLNITLAWSVAIFTAAFAMLTALLCGLAPALHATRHALSDVLKDASTSTTARSRLQRGFVVAQIALAQPLLVALATFSVLIATRMGSVTAPEIEDRLVVARIEGYREEGRTNAPARLKDVIRRLEGVSGVRAVSTYQFTFGHSDGGVLEPLHNGSHQIATSERIRIGADRIAPEYFPAVDIQLVKGRLFTAADTVPNNVPIIVTTKFADEFIAGGEPIGRQFRMGNERGVIGKEVATIVGVVKASQVGGNAGHIFRPLGFASSLLIRTTIPADPLIPMIRGVIKSEAPTLPIESIKSIASINRSSRTEMLQFSGLAAGGGAITLLLGCVGLYAVVALAVGQRKREIGIRIALGAKPTQVVSMFFNGGLRLSLVGLAIGLPLSAAAMKIIISQVEVIDINMVPLTMLVALVVVFVAAVATWFPARRAAHVDPVVALRSE